MSPSRTRPRRRTTPAERRVWLLAVVAAVAALALLRSVHRPPDRDLPVSYSAHAEQRMEERRITPEEVEETVRQGNWRPGREKGRFESIRHVSGPHAISRRIQVVFTVEDERIVVITVFAASR